jgi:hypothetical protein
MEPANKKFSKQIGTFLDKDNSNLTPGHMALASSQMRHEN